MSTIKHEASGDDDDVPLVKRQKMITTSSTSMVTTVPTSNGNGRNMSQVKRPFPSDDDDKGDDDEYDNKANGNDNNYNDDDDEDYSEDDQPLIKRVKKEKKSPPDDDDDEDYSEDDQPLIKRVKKEKKSPPDDNDDDDDDEDYSEDDQPLIKRVKKEKKSPPKKKARKKKAKYDSSDFECSDDEPLSVRMKKAKDESDFEYSDEDDEPLALRMKSPDKKKKKAAAAVKKEKKSTASSKKKNVKSEKVVKISAAERRRIKMEEEEKSRWKWWEEDQVELEEGERWKFLEHAGVYFPPPYEPLPNDVKLKYDGEAIALNVEAEEVAGFYAAMAATDYATKDIFNRNFFKDWRKTMSLEIREKIKDMKKCDFTSMTRYFEEQRELRKGRSKEEKDVDKKKNQALIEKYGYAMVDGHKEKIGNFRVEPPGLFRGRGEHPKMGRLKLRLQPEDITINCSSDSKIPVPPEGHRWKEVVNNNKVTWLAGWIENIAGNNKYVMLNAASRLKGQNDMKKYDIARDLQKHIVTIRTNYRNDFKSKEMVIRQRATALYFIDKLALRAGGEKDTDEEADTVGCCSLRYEHIKLRQEKDDDSDEVKYLVDFDFLGKDSIRYENTMEIEERVYKNLGRFMENKTVNDSLFDRLTVPQLNKHLQTLMIGLTAKVFRTYNASSTLRDQLEDTPEDGTDAEKILAYNRANRQVAVLCNHQRAVPKSFSQSMERMDEKIKAKEKDIKAEAKKAKAESDKTKKKKILARVDRFKEQLHKLELQRTDRDENKSIALGTSKINYLDPRISVAWSKKFGIPLEKIYNATQRDKFSWARGVDEDWLF